MMNANEITQLQNSLRHQKFYNVRLVEGGGQSSNAQPRWSTTGVKSSFRLGYFFNMFWAGQKVKEVS